MKKNTVLILSLVMLPMLYGCNDAFIQNDDILDSGEDIIIIPKFEDEIASRVGAVVIIGVVVAAAAGLITARGHVGIDGVACMAVVGTGDVYLAFLVGYADFVAVDGCGMSLAYGCNKVVAGIGVLNGVFLCYGIACDVCRI